MFNFLQQKPWHIYIKFFNTLISCPWTASGPYPTTLSQKARPEGDTVSSQVAPSAAWVGWGAKSTSRRPRQKPKPIASLLLSKFGFSFSCSTCSEEEDELLLCGWLKILTLDVSDVVTSLWSKMFCVLNFLGLQVPSEDANELISIFNQPLIW